MVAIPKKLFALIIDLMEAHVEGHPLRAGGHPFTYHPEQECYLGAFNPSQIEALVKKGLLNIVTAEDGSEAIAFPDRDSFIVSFAAGALDASRGNDPYYADYASNPFGFTAGYQHFIERKRAKTPAYVYSDGYYCHGFKCEDTDEVYLQ